MPSTGVWTGELSDKERGVRHYGNMVSYSAVMTQYRPAGISRGSDAYRGSRIVERSGAGFVLTALMFGN